MQFQTLIAARLLCRHGKKIRGNWWTRRLMSRTLTAPLFSIYELHKKVLHNSESKVCFDVISLPIPGAKKSSSKSFSINLTLLTCTAALKWEKLRLKKLFGVVKPSHRFFPLIIEYFLNSRALRSFINFLMLRESQKYYKINKTTWDEKFCLRKTENEK